jgi:hypothetical protein
MLLIVMQFTLLHVRIASKIQMSPVTLGLFLDVSLTVLEFPPTSPAQMAVSPLLQFVPVSLDTLSKGNCVNLTLCVEMEYSLQENHVTLILKTLFTYSPM